MATIHQIRKIALSFPETSEVPHFEKTSFRVRKRIFATYNAKENRICVRLSRIDQDVFTAFNPELIHPVPNKFGTMGWTLIYFKQVPMDLITDVLTCAYCEVAPLKLSKEMKDNLMEGY